MQHIPHASRGFLASSLKRLCTLGIAGAALICTSCGPSSTPTTSGATTQGAASQAMQEAMNATSTGGARAAAARKGGSAMSTSAAQTLWRSVQGAANDSEGAVLALQQGDRGLVRSASYRINGAGSTSLALGSATIDLATLKPALDRLKDQISRLSQDEQLEVWKSFDQLIAGAHESANSWARAEGGGSLGAAGKLCVQHRIWALEQMNKLGEAALEFPPMRSLAAMKDSLRTGTPMQDVP